MRIAILRPSEDADSRPASDSKALRQVMHSNADGNYEAVG